MTSKNKQTIAQVLDEIWTQGNAGAVDALISPTYTLFHDPGDAYDGQTLDIEGYKERLISSRGPFPDQAFEIIDMVEEDDKVVVTWKWQGTHMGDIPGFKASGKPISMTGITLYSFKEGKVSGHWQMVNRLAVFQQLQQNAAEAASAS